MFCQSLLSPICVYIFFISIYTINIINYRSNKMNENKKNLGINLAYTAFDDIPKALILI